MTSTLVRRAAGLSVNWEGGDELARVTDARGGVTTVPDWGIRVLGCAGHDVQIDELSARAQVSRMAVETLARTPLLVRLGTNSNPVEVNSLWTPEEVGMRFLACRGGMRESVDWEQLPSADVLLPYDDRVELPEVDNYSDEETLGKLLYRRRSVREFHRGSVSLGIVGELLTSACRTLYHDERTHAKKKPYPSGGGRHPIEIFLLPRRVEGLDDHKLYRYDGGDALLGTALDDAYIRGVAGWIPGGDGVKTAEPACVILFVAMFGRTFWKYEKCALALVFKDTGCAMQTIHLRAVSLGLCGYPVAAAPEHLFISALGMDPLEAGLTGLFFLGNP